MTNETTAAIDPNYTEPPTAADWRAEIARMFPPDAPGAPNDCGVALDGLRIQGVLYAMVMRITALEKALEPFAKKAAVFDNARMCLAADGRPGEPAGGTWYSTLKNISLSQDENIFYDACDVYGRKRVEDAMLAVFKRVQEAAEAATQKAAHIENFGREH